MRVRPYELSDFAVMCALGKMMHTESPVFRDFDFDPRSLLELSDALLGSELLHCVVAENQHGITGFMFGVSPFFFGRDLYLYDTGFYVRPECRGGTSAIRLLNYFMAWGKAKGAKQARLAARPASIRRPSTSFSGVSASGRRALSIRCPCDVI